MVFLMAAGRCREPLAQSLGGQQSFNKSQSVLCHYINIFGQLLWRSGGAGSHHIPSYASTGETSGAANPWKWNQKTRSFSLVYLQTLRIFYMHEKKKWKSNFQVWNHSPGTQRYSHDYLFFFWLQHCKSRVCWLTLYNNLFPNVSIQ